LAGISGLDLAAGLYNVQNKLPFYLRQLRHFTERHADEAAKIEQLLAAGDLQAAQIAAHSLKGAAATLGVTQIGHVAAAIELPLKQKTANTAEQLASFIAEVQAVLPVSSPNLESSLSPYPAEQLRAVIDKLSNLLTEGNIQSQAYLHDHRAELCQALGREVAEVLSRDVEVFAFDKALEALRRSRD
jgi:HPt (histidine-containing phosphotransfer) domain-containing protein